MSILKFIFQIVGAMATIYVIFNFKDFLTSWGAWILLLVKGVWKGIKWLWNKLINVFKRK